MGSKILREVFEEELTDYLQLNQAIKSIDNYLKLKEKSSKMVIELESQYERLIYGNSA